VNLSISLLTHHLVNLSTYSVQLEVHYSEEFDSLLGTSDEHITVVENLQTYSPDGAILVSTPQAVSLADVRRELSFCRRTGLPVLGLVENMSGFVCPHCSECTNVFSCGGGESFAHESQIPFLGRIPLDPSLAQCTEEGQSLAKVFPASPSNQAVRKVVDNLLAQLENRTSRITAEQKST
jgi:MinD superfamily P-loop ATPase